MNKNTGRYCLQILREFDNKTNLETWVTTEKCSESLDILMQFMSQGTRIVDSHRNNREVRRNFNRDNW